MNIAMLWVHNYKNIMKTINKAYKASSLLCSSIGSSQDIHVKEKALRMKPTTFDTFVLPSNERPWK